MDTHDAFISEIEQFLTASGIAPSRLGTEALGDPTFVFELRKGRKPSMAVGDRVRAWMKAHGKDRGRA